MPYICSRLCFVYIALGLAITSLCDARASDDIQTKFGGDMEVFCRTAMQNDPDCIAYYATNRRPPEVIVSASMSDGVLKVDLFDYISDDKSDLRRVTGKRHFEITGIGKPIKTSAVNGPDGYSISILDQLSTLKSPSSNSPVVITCVDCASSSTNVRVNKKVYLNLAKAQQEQLAIERRHKQEQLATEKRIKQEEARIAREGDGGVDDIACKKYGLKPGTQVYASCRIQIDAIRQQSLQQAQADQRRYEEEQRRYDELKTAQEKERRRQQGLKALELSGRLMSGQSATAAISGMSGISAPIPPQPTSTNRTIRMPDGSFMHCNTVNNITTCF